MLSTEHSGDGGMRTCLSTHVDLVGQVHPLFVVSHTLALLVRQHALKRTQGQSDQRMVRKIQRGSDRTKATRFRRTRDSGTGSAVPRLSTPLRTELGS